MVVEPRRLRRPDARAGDPCLERKRDTRDESAAAAGHDDVVGSHVQISALLGDLETHGALACDDIEVVKCRHDHRLSLGSDPSGDLLAALAVAIVLDDARAERARVLELGARRVVRHDDRGRHPSSRAAAATPCAWLPEE